MAAESRAQGARLAGGAAAALGVLVLLGWHLRVSTLIRIRADLPAMAYGTALCFVLAGTGLVAFTFRRPALARGAAAGSLTLAVATLADYLLGTDLVLSRLGPALVGEAGSRMPPNTALAFALAGVTVMAVARRGGARLQVVGILGSLVLAIGGVSFFGYWSGLETTYGWGSLAAMALHASVGLAVLGAGFLALAWPPDRGRSPEWLPWAIGIAGVGITVVLWQALVAADAARIRERLGREGTLIERTIRERLETEMLVLTHLPALDAWAGQRGAAVEGSGAAVSLLGAAWVDGSFSILRESLPGPEQAASAREVFGDPAALAAALHAAAPGRPALARAPGPADDGAYLLLLPEPPGVAGAAWAVGLLHPAAWLASLAGAERVAEFAVFDGAREVYRSAAGPPAPRGIAMDVDLPGVTWTIVAWPAVAWLESRDSPAEELVLAAGILLAGAGALAAQLFRRAVARAEEAEAAGGEREREIAHRRRAEEALRAQRELFESVLRSIGDGVVATDAHGRFLVYNPAAEAIVPMGPADLDPAAWSEHYGIFLPDQVTPYPPADLPVARAMRGEIADEELLFVRNAKLPAGKWLRVTARPLRDAAGGVAGGVGIFRDITDRKAADERIEELNRGLQRRTEEMELANRELEAFSYSVSHDLRAPLRHISGFSDLLRAHAGPSLDEKAKRYLDTIVQAAGRMAALIDDLLGFSRMGRTEMRRGPMALDAMVAGVVQELQGEMNGRRVEWRIGPLPEVRGDRAMLRVVLTNLVGNALKYSRHRELARIDIGARESDGETVVFVRDNGAGFDMRYADKLFGVFQRLHRPDEFEGTGIGLATVRRIVHRHGGRTWAEGEVDRGATLYFSLPATTEGCR